MTSFNISDRIRVIKGPYRGNTGIILGNMDSDNEYCVKVDNLIEGYTSIAGDCFPYDDEVELIT